MERFHENCKYLHVNTEDDRSYYIPHTSIDEAKRNQLQAGSTITSLCGVWNFEYFNCYDEMPDNFSFNNKIDVPSVWQNYGYDKHQYTNVKYPFAFQPPYVPVNNPCGVYQRKFNVNIKDSMSYYINFEGVDSCFYMYINNNFVGYSQVSHSTSEFDISKYIHKGENEIIVKVLKFCDGSYLEDQDKFRMSGIFRPVYVIERPKEHLRDYFIHQELDGKKVKVKIDLDFINKNLPVTCTVTAPNGEKILSTVSKRKSIDFEIKSPWHWNAEQTNVYKFLLECNNEYIVQQFAVCNVSSEDGIIKVNGKSIKFRGVNRHDSDPKTGSAISREQVIKDMQIMKEHNINAIRTSHYPNAPWFPQLCTEYGFYLIAEADIECHGEVELYPNVSSEDAYVKKMRLIPDMELFEEAILDRNKMNVIRDKNNYCIVMWSLGNETGFGKNFVKAAEWIKKYDSSRLVHCECASREELYFDIDTSMIDVHSRMYPTLQEVIKREEEGKDLRPYVFCEYIHAMGNGPGDIADYQELIDKYPRLCGGFVWEFCDHAIDMGKTINGKKKYFYGGDFNEYPNDGNFCMDGLVYPDRKLHTGIKEYKNVIRPIRAKLISKSPLIVKITNYLDFLDLKGNFKLKASVYVNGCVKETKYYNLPSIKAHNSAELNIDLNIDSELNCMLLLEYIRTNSSGLIKANSLAGFDSLQINNSMFIPEIKTLKASKIKIEKIKNRYIVYNDSFRYVFNNLYGVIEDMSINNQKIICKAMEYNIWRAPTDNDREVRKLWELAGFNIAEFRAFDSKIEEDDDCVKITCIIEGAALVRQWSVKANVVYTIFNNGKIDVDIKGVRNMDMPYLPRFGLRIFLPLQYSNTEYFGFGPYESYVDKHRASYKAFFTTNAESNHEDYIKPQENGTHYACTYIALGKDNENQLSLSSKNEFSFNISRYTQEELSAKAHNFELEKSPYIILCVDGLHSGIGSNSCGPELAKKYRIEDENIYTNFSIIPNYK